MKKNNFLSMHNKFSIPKIGSCAISKENFEMSWKWNSNTSSMQENFSPGDIALITDIKNLSAGRKIIQILYKQNIYFLPYNLKNSFYFIKPNEALNNKNFCITGKLRYERKFYENLICLFGGTYKKNISDQVNFLLTNGSKKTNKIILAKKYEIKILNENNFWELLIHS